MCTGPMEPHTHQQLRLTAPQKTLLWDRHWLPRRLLLLSEGPTQACTTAASTANTRACSKRRIFNHQSFKSVRKRKKLRMREPGLSAEGETSCRSSLATAALTV